jgi:acyl transferase domain-containing protein/acyl carrier protein/SAM-dependent methyltransferase
MVGTGQMGVLSPDGRCKTFDKGADGYVKGEGVGSLLLKPLNRAVEDRDHIYAVIKGTAENHGGKAASLTAPNSEAQAALLAGAYEEAGMDPETVTYVETHGTGTELGDPVEIDGLKKAFDELAGRRGKAISRRHYCGLGSVKTNVGHLEPAAGMAGMMKVILAMQHRKLPGTLHLRELNPYIDLEETPFYVVERTQPWKRVEDEHGDPIPLRAGVSSFGFGGSNAHVVLEEHESPIPPAGPEPQSPQIIVLSAKSRDRLLDYARGMADFLQETTTEGNLRQADGESLPLAIQKRLIKLASDILQVREQDIEPEEDMWEQGFDQITLSKFRDRLNENYRSDITQDLLSELRSIGSLARYLCHDEHREHFAQYPSERTKRISEERDGQWNFSLADVAYTLHVGRDAMDERLAVIASSIGELAAKLTQYDQGRTDIEGLYTGSATLDQGHMGLLVEGRAGEEFIKAVIDDRDLAKLALLWVSGVEMDWRLLYAARTPRRIPLPTYPFARERHWLSASAPGQYEGGTSLHPLIDRVDPKLSVGHGIAFRKVFRSADLILRDHKVDGMPVLPAMAHLEMALAAVSQIKGDHCPSIHRSFWLNPLTVPDDNREVRIVINEDNGKLRYEIQTGTHTQTITHSEGEFLLDNMPSVITDQRISVEETKARCSHHIDKETLYAMFKHAGITYGAYFQGLNEVWGSNEEALGYLSLPPEHEHQLKQYTLHPSLMDAALQTVAGIARLKGETGTRPRLPFAVERVEILHPVNSKGYAYVKADGKYRFNVAILDETGLVCVKLHNVAVRELKDPLQRFFYTPRWASSPLSAVPGEERAAGEYPETDTRTVLVVCGPRSPGLDDGFAETHADDEVIVVRLGSETRQDSNRKWEIRAEDPTSLDTCIGKLENIHTVYFLGGLESRALDMDDLDSLEESQEYGVLSLLRLVKSLSRHGFRQKSIELKVVTNDVHQVAPEEMTKPHQASLHGLTSSMVKEYPQWHISCVDISLRGVKKRLSKQRVRELVEAIRAETCLKPGEAVAIREGKRYVRTLHPILLPPVTETPFRHNGVYFILGGAGGIGLELSRYLAETVQAGLVLIGRSELNDDQKKRISLIESRGGKVLYLQAEATNLQSMETAVQRAKSHFGRIDGVIHSALVLRDKTLENMDEESFRAALGPKVRGSVILHKVMRDEPLDFMMFFSSAQSFSGNTGQGNYAAGSTFEDALALYLGRQESYPVKVINWGYWGSVGIVASEEYNKRLASIGVQSITSEEGMEAVRRILAHNVGQIMPLRARDYVLEQMGADLQHQIELYPETGPSLVSTVAHQVEAWRAATAATQDVDHMEAFRQLERLGQCLLLEAFQKMGVFKHGGEQYGRLQLREHLGIVPHYHRLYEALLDILIRGGFIRAKAHDVIVSQVLEKGQFQSELESLDDKRNHLITSFPSLEPYLNLLSVCLKAYPELLTGQRSYVEVMFPRGSMDLVENIYKGNRVTDYYNNLVAQIVETYVQLKAQGVDNEKIRILEVGAGTGATSASVLRQIEDYADKVHYCYSDISVGFTQHGERKFGEGRPFMEFKVLDIERQPDEQDFEPNSYDLILASNVIHATKRIENTLNQAKRLLRNRGLLIVSEATQKQDFVTLTFGLTDGWWLFEDEENRIKESPLLSPGDWMKVLQTNGFQHIQVFGMPSAAAETSQQNVIIAESDGAVLVDGTQQAIGDRERELITPPISQDTQRPRRIRKDFEPSPLTPEHHPAKCLMEGTLDYVKAVFAEVLKISETQIESQATFEKFGVDSLLAMEIIHRLERDFGDLPATLLFEYMTVERLSEYFVSHHQERLAAVIRPQTELSDAGELFANVPISELVDEGQLSGDRSERGVSMIASRMAFSANTESYEGARAFVEQLSDAEVDALLERLLREVRDEEDEHE